MVDMTKRNRHTDGTACAGHRCAWKNDSHHVTGDSIFTHVQPQFVEAIGRPLATSEDAFLQDLCRFIADDSADQYPPTQGTVVHRNQALQAASGLDKVLGSGTLMEVLSFRLKPGDLIVLGNCVRRVRKVETDGTGETVGVDVERLSPSAQTWVYAGGWELEFSRANMVVRP
jgi:hypothetical protein